MIRMAVAVTTEDGGEAKNRCAMCGNSCMHTSNCNVMNCKVRRVSRKSLTGQIMVEVVPCWLMIRCNMPRYGTKPSPIPCRSTTGGPDAKDPVELCACKPLGGRYQYDSSPAWAWVKPARVSHTQPTACAVYLAKSLQFLAPVRLCKHILPRVSEVDHCYRRATLRT